MLDISVLTGIEFRMDWPRWKRLIHEIERAGYAGLYVSDHFAWHGAAGNALESIVALTYLADHTERVRIGALVSPFTVREPVMLLCQTIALDDLSNGRMILGVGAGNRDNEHLMFGYDFADVPTRMARLEEGLEVITRLLHSQGPTSFAGRFYRLENAELPPRRRNGPPIVVGGKGPRRTIPLHIERKRSVRLPTAYPPAQPAARPQPPPNATALRETRIPSPERRSGIKRRRTSEPTTHDQRYETPPVMTRGRLCIA